MHHLGVSSNHQHSYCTASIKTLGLNSRHTCSLQHYAYLHPPKLCNGQFLAHHVMCCLSSNSRLLCASFSCIELSASVLLVKLMQCSWCTDKFLGSRERANEQQSLSAAIRDTTSCANGVSIQGQAFHHVKPKYAVACSAVCP